MSDQVKGGGELVSEWSTTENGGLQLSTIARLNCEICRKPIEPSATAFKVAHTECLNCPECKSSFVARTMENSHAVLRCLNCLHRWEGVR